MEEISNWRSHVVDFNREIASFSSFQVIFRAPAMCTFATLGID
jgi:hypothetical protein